MHQKQCNKCLQFLSVNLFSKNKTRKDGLCNFCKKCQKEYYKKHYSTNRKYYEDKSKKQKESLKQKYIEFKSKLICCKCGENHIACLEFHHKNPKEKDKQISTLFRCGYSKDRIEKELQKCIILCANCHRKLHHEEYGSLV